MVYSTKHTKQIKTLWENKETKTAPSKRREKMCKNGDIERKEEALWEDLQDEY